MIKNILIVIVSISLVAYSVEKKIVVNELQEEVIKMNYTIAIADSLMKDNTIQALQLVAYLDDCGRKIDGFKKKINNQEANKIKVTVTMYPCPRTNRQYSEHHRRWYCV